MFPGAAEKMKEINEVYAFLSDQEFLSTVLERNFKKWSYLS